MPMSSGGAYAAPPVDESGIYQTQWTGGPAAKQPAGGGVSGSGSGGRGASSPGFLVESDGMRSQAAVIARCGERIAQVLATLRATLVAGGEPWGTDEMAQKFGASYTGPANQGFASIAGLGAALTNVANQLVAQADRYDALDQQIADTFGKLAGRQRGEGEPGGSARTGGSGAASGNFTASHGPAGLVGAAGVAGAAAGGSPVAPENAGNAAGAADGANSSAAAG